MDCLLWPKTMLVVRMIFTLPKLFVISVIYFFNFSVVYLSTCHFWNVNNHPPPNLHRPPFLVQDHDSLIQEYHQYPHQPIHLLQHLLPHHHHPPLPHYSFTHLSIYLPSLKKDLRQNFSHFAVPFKREKLILHQASFPLWITKHVI